MLFIALSIFSIVNGERESDDDFVTLNLEIGGASKTASRQIMTTIAIGKPQERYTLLIDFSRNEIDMKYCMRSRSFTFDISTNETSDIVMLSDDSLLDPVKRGIYRMPIREHCAADEPFNSPECIALGSCDGVLGLGPTSPIWVKWSSATITKSSIHLGQKNPHRQQKKSETVACVGSLTDSNLCSFNAAFAGRMLTVDFHSHDSYIYVPADIYQRYTEERNLYGFTNAQKRSAMQLQAARHTAQVLGKTNVDEDEQRAVVNSRILFSERLENERQLALQYSSYYKATHEITDRANWPPIVLLPTLSSHLSATTNIIVLDHDLIVYSPFSSGTYGKRRRISSSVPFAEYSDSMMTLMLRPHANESITNRVSLGNMFFRRYNLHIDRVENTVEIVERFASENLANIEVLGGLYLFGYFIYAVCRMMSYSVGLSVTLNRRCPVCSQPKSPYFKHNLPNAALVLLGVAGDMLMVAIASWLLQHIGTLLLDSAAPPDASAFLTWSWLLAVPNILTVIAIRFTSPGHSAPPDGTFCWRTFRWTMAYSACSEQLALLGLLWMSIILQTDTLGTTLSAFLCAAIFFSAVHHFVHVYLFEHDLLSNLRKFALKTIEKTFPRKQGTAIQLLQPQQQQPPPQQQKENRHQGDFPDEKTELVWIAFVLVVLFLLNLVFTTFVTLRYIVVPVLNSFPMSVLIFGIALLLALWLLETYEKITISRTGFKQALF